MNAKEKFDQLLAGEGFQNDILNLGNLSVKEKKLILDRYSISKRELTYAKRLLSGFSFKKNELAHEEVGYALNKVITRIRETSGSKAERISFIGLVSRVAAILTIPLLLSTVYFYQKNKSLNSEYFSSVSQEQKINTFQALPGAKTQVVLPDGSIVWLNSGSSILCPTMFDSKSRNVELKGEAYFEVVKNEKVPMIVTAGNIKVKVYGTKFNLHAYAGEDKIETTLVDGKVSILTGDSKNEYLLTPGNRAVYDLHKKYLKFEKVQNMDAFIGWKEGKLLFHDENFADIIKKLERWYNVDIQLSDVSLGKYTLYATFFDENIEQVLQILSNSIPITPEYPKRIKQADGSYSKRKVVIKRNVNKVMMIN